MLVHPGSLSPANAAVPVIEELRHHRGIGPYVSHEYLASQVEFSSPVFASAGQAETMTLAFRKAATDAAQRQGVIAASVGVPFQPANPPLVTDVPRYRRIAADHGAITLGHQVNALHVHVGVRSRSDGVVALNGLRVWLPVLLALSGNSPFWQGRDTGFASWRSVQMRRWTTAGCPPMMFDEQDYRRRTTALVGVGGTTDVRTIAWNARLSEDNPTVEIRVFDAQLDVDDTVFLAVISRALTDTVIRSAGNDRLPNDVDPELLDASLWLACRDGLTGDLVHPLRAELAPAKDVVSALIDLSRDALVESGDEPRVRTKVGRLFHEGAGAERQRRAMQTGGRRALRTLLQGVPSGATHNQGTFPGSNARGATRTDTALTDTALFDTAPL